MAEGEALRIFATDLRKFDDIGFAFRALGDSLHAEIMRQRDDGAQHRGAVALAYIGLAAGEGAVDLDRVEGETLKIGERRIARAEIVEGEAGAQFLDPAEYLR